MFFPWRYEVPTLAGPVVFPCRYGTVSLQVRCFFPWKYDSSLAFLGLFFPCRYDTPDPRIDQTVDDIAEVLILADEESLSLVVNVPPDINRNLPVVRIAAFRETFWGFCTGRLRWSVCPGLTFEDWRQSVVLTHSSS